MIDPSNQQGNFSAFSQSGNVQADTFEFDEPKEFMELVNMHSVQSWLQQKLFTEFIGTHSWEMDFYAGEIIFGGSIRIPIQILGTINNQTEVYQWYWSIPRATTPDNLKDMGREMRVLGEKLKIEELLTENFLDWPNMQDHFGFIAIGVLGAKGYYYANYGSGGLFVALSATEISSPPLFSAPEIVRHFIQYCTEFHYEQSRALVWFLKAQGYSVTKEGYDFKAVKGGEQILARMNEEREIVAISAEPLTA